MSASYIIAEARLSTPTISSTRGPNPNLIISLRLEGTDNPITIAKPLLPQLFIPTNAVVLKDMTTEEPIATPTPDINRKTSPPLKLVAEMADKFVTLDHHRTCKIVRDSFDPLRAQRKGEKAADLASKLAKYAGGILGIHLLKPEKDYALSIRNDLSIHTWMEGRAEDLVHAVAEWRPRSEIIKVLPAKPFHFRLQV